MAAEGEGENNNERQQQEAAARLVPEHRRIEDTDAWFRTNTLRDNVEPAPTLGQQEDAERFEQLKTYQETIMVDMFADADAEEQRLKEEKARQMEALRDGQLVFQTKDGDTKSMPLYPFAASCDTVFALSTSWVQQEQWEETKVVVCKLVDYSLASTEKFATCVMALKKVEDLESDAVVDVCCLADYLQNREIRDAAEIILKNSIDTANCLSICQLADQLGMPSLFELSLQHMMDTLGTIDEGSDCWEELTPDLRERVMVIKTAIQSSFHSQRSKLYFHSLEEYISIFAEKVQYYRERLAEAKDQFKDLLPGTHLWLDTQTKITKQEQRVRTLSAALSGQKRLFSKSHRTNVVPTHLDQNREVV